MSNSFPFSVNQLSVDDISLETSLEELKKQPGWHFDLESDLPAAYHHTNGVGIVAWIAEGLVTGVFGSNLKCGEESLFRVGDEREKVRRILGLESPLLGESFNAAEIGFGLNFDGDYVSRVGIYRPKR